jgi:hypothetical protein
LPPKSAYKQYFRRSASSEMMLKGQGFLCAMREAIKCATAALILACHRPDGLTTQQDREGTSLRMLLPAFNTPEGVTSEHADIPRSCHGKQAMRWREEYKSIPQPYPTVWAFGIESS